VPALFALPTDQPPLGCLRGGLGPTKEEFPQVRQGAATLRLATFTIDPWHGGARGIVAQMVAALKTPETLLAMVFDTLVDLRVGREYLESRPEWRHNIAYMGTSLGGVVGALFAGQDQRVLAVVLTSIGATFKEAMLVGANAAKTIPNLPVQVPGAATHPAILAHAVSVLRPYDPAKVAVQVAEFLAGNLGLPTPF
jgi:hypothetical protein